MTSLMRLSYLVRRAGHPEHVALIDRPAIQCHKSSASEAPDPGAIRATSSRNARAASSVSAVDFSKLTRDQAAALQEATVEDFKDGRGEDAHDVRKIPFKLADERAALVVDDAAGVVLRCDAERRPLI